jgi:hypothetical protein
VSDPSSGISDTLEGISDHVNLTVLSPEQVQQIRAAADANLPATIPQEIPAKAVREPRFHRSDIQAALGFSVLGLFLLLLALKFYEYHLVCHDERDWDQVFEPFVTAVVLGIGSVIGYFFARDRRDP